MAYLFCQKCKAYKRSEHLALQDGHCDCGNPLLEPEKEEDGTSYEQLKKLILQFENQRLR